MSAHHLASGFQPELISRLLTLSVESTVETSLYAFEESRSVWHGTASCKLPTSSLIPILSFGTLLSRAFQPSSFQDLAEEVLDDLPHRMCPKTL